MFHQVRVSSEDQSALQMLLWLNGNNDKRSKAYGMTIHLFEITSSAIVASLPAYIRLQSCASRIVRLKQLRRLKRHAMLMTFAYQTKRIESRELVLDLRSFLCCRGFRLTNGLQLVKMLL